MTQFTRIHDHFEYHLEDTACDACLYYKGKIRGCTLTACCCEDIKREVIENGRIKRERGWFKCRE